MKDNKILVLGIGQSNFLNQLYENLSIDNPSLSIDIDGYVDISQGKNLSSNFQYGNYFDFKKVKIHKILLLKKMFQLLFSNFFWKIVFFELSQGLTIKKFFDLIKEYTRTKYIVENYIQPKNYQIFHFHFCTPENLKYLYFLSKNSKSICSFWGSDLLRATGPSNVFYVQLALEKASIVTVQTRELAEVLFCKYGRNLTQKTQYLPFTISTKIYESIDKYKLDFKVIEDFKIKYKIPVDRKVIVISHNAFKENNHIKVLEELNKISNSIKKEITVVLPLAYGRDEKYINKLKAIKIENIEITLILDYFDSNEIALLRLATDIMIQMPISDALSGTMTEVLYAGNKVIAGSWLPYGLLRRKEVIFSEIDDFSDLVPAIEKLLKSTENNNNSAIIKSILFPNTTTPLWNNLFKNLLDE
ncbi:hypothetical protein EV143_104226 [Flavobacterium chryseum]|uniref:hypothetical protein n=1 Tax=Flavobacterium sp. P3160 TaxID=2512113 RepID=UPI00105BC2D4|nr:hypothetical protein [Flavobacterium sp. P3160]TDO77462.1 hypothetical protein EV143_104226 [Flavobacterium sp. P3160]